MGQGEGYFHTRKLTAANQFVVLLLKFTVNFNESLLSASFVQTFLKFYGITLWSSTIIWAFPPLLYILLSPLYRFVFMNHKYDSFLRNLAAQSLLFFFSALGFISLFNLELFSAAQLPPSALLLFIGGVSFTVIDFSKYIYENLVFDYMADYVGLLSGPQFAYLGIVIQKLGRICGAFISCLYVVRGKTDFAQFSADFYTNMQFAYYTAICLNSVAVASIFLCWPQVFNLQLKEATVAPGSLLDYFLPGFSYALRVRPGTRRLLLRLFFVYGLYWFIATNLTQWVSNKFMADYPSVVTNSAIQAIDVGTSWGSLSLTIFYTLWGMAHVAVHPLVHRLFRLSKHISRTLNFAGFFIYSAVFWLYAERDVRYLVMLQGFGGLCYDWVLHEKIRLKLQRDPAFAALSPAQAQIMAVRVMEVVEFVAEITFFVVEPIVFVRVSDRAQILFIGFIMGALGLTVPSAPAIQL